MKVNINAVHFTADVKLKDLITEKLNRMMRFDDKLLTVDVYLKLENAGQVKDKIVELQAKVPGKTIFASSKEKTFEIAFDAAQEIIIRQLKRNKERLREAIELPIVIEESMDI
jgi:putative sigma-54 modulation protein